MPIYVDTLPQKIEKTKIITLLEFVRALPETLPYNINVWVAHKLARFGKTNTDVIFLTDGVEQPSNELMQYFDSIVQPLGISGTLSNGYNFSKFLAMRLYDKGKLIIDKETGNYTKIPSAVEDAPMLTTQHVLANLPRSLDFKQTIYLTGSIVRHGWSNNDADFITFDEISEEDLEKLARLFSIALGWKTHVGRKVMQEREPVYLYKLYEGGEWQASQ